MKASDPTSLHDALVGIVVLSANVLMADIEHAQIARPKMPPLPDDDFVEPEQAEAATG